MPGDNIQRITFVDLELYDFNICIYMLHFIHITYFNLSFQDFVKNLAKIFYTCMFNFNLLYHTQGVMCDIIW